MPLHGERARELASHPGARKIEAQGSPSDRRLSNASAPRRETYTLGAIGLGHANHEELPPLHLLMTAFGENRCRQIDFALQNRYSVGPPKIPKNPEVNQMILDRVDAGKDIPNDLNVIIEIPAFADPVKYEVDKDTGALFVDRFMNVAMSYPCNYGYVPDTLCEDGDPLDVLVVTPFPLVSGCVVRCRPLGLLKMADEAGGDSKLVAVPIVKMCAMYEDIKSTDDLPKVLLQQIEHFFEHYKDLDPGKWVKIDGWGGYDDAIDEISSSVTRYESTKGDA